MNNTQFLIAAILTIAGGSLHFYTMEVWIWPKLKPECFPTFPFGDNRAVMTFYRIVWHFFTVTFVLTAATLLIFTFTDNTQFAGTIARFLALFWIGNVMVSLILAYLALQPGDSFIKSLIRAPQWAVMLAMVVFIVWGSTYY